jgi:hypothetical protein
MNQKFTRRRLAAAAFGPAAALRAAQTTAASHPEDLNTTAKEQLRKSSEALGKTPLPMSTEPAFSFKA